MITRKEENMNERRKEKKKHKKMKNSGERNE